MNVTIKQHLPPLEEFAASVVSQVHQEQIVAGETCQNIVENPTVQERVIVQKIPEVQVVERIQEQILETIKTVPKERVQQRTVENIVDVSVRRVQAQIVEVVKVFPQDRISKQIVEQIVDVLVPQIVEDR